MLKKTLKYTDYLGNEREEDFYFNLTKAELLEMEMSEAGGFEEMLNRIISSQDSKKIIQTFKEIILKAYGVRSPDGRRFIKSEELSTEFSQTEAYSDLFMELATNADKASEFIQGIIPKLEEDDAKKAVPAPNNIVPMKTNN